jgi:hypothetical protein
VIEGADFGGELHNVELAKVGSAVIEMRKLGRALERGTDYKGCDRTVGDLQQSWSITVIMEGT